VTTATTAATEATATGSQGLFPNTGRLDAEAAGAYVGELFAEHGRMVLGLSRLLLRDPIEAEDAAQQAFLSAHHALLRGSVPRDGAAWIAAVARNECRARIHARMREPLTLPEVPSDLPDPLAAALRATDLEAVWTAFGALPRRQRRALLMRELGGLSYHELGRALGASHSAVESLLFRARRRVRSLALGPHAAFAPIAVRDQLTQAIPGFDPGSAGVVARLAALPVAWKLAGAAVSVGVVATGASSVHPRAHPVAQPRPRETTALVRPQADAVRPRVHPLTDVSAVVTRPVIQERRREREIEVEAPHADEHEQSTEIVATSNEGPGPGQRSEPAQLEQAHEGPGDGGQTETTEDRSGRDASGHESGVVSGSDDGSSHSGPG
jgi:RNA polymerase sigma-70 factor (ECF subfamily)